MLNYVMFKKKTFVKVNGTGCMPSHAVILGKKDLLAYLFM